MKRGALKRRVPQVVTFECADCGVVVERRKVGAGLCRSCSQKRNAAKGGPPRRGKTKNCAVCGEEFYVEPVRLESRKFCSRACMGRASRVSRTCLICGTEFQSRKRRKTCSPACQSEAKRRSKVKTANPNYKNGESRARIEWRAAAGKRCAKCGGERGRMHHHHVVYEQHVRREGGDPFDRRNGLTLCFACHMGHHHGIDRRVCVSDLRPENVAFAAELLGEAARYYFPRYYDDDAPYRLTEALAGVAA